MTIYNREDYRAVLPQLEKQIDELQSRIQELETTLEDRTKQDFVVEQGTSSNGLYTYRKWNSGIAELWGTTAKVNYNITTQYGGTYYTTITIGIMSGIFNKVTALTVNRANGGQGTVWCSPDCSYDTVKNGSISMYVSNGTSYSSAPLSFSIYVKGTWK